MYGFAPDAYTSVLYGYVTLIFRTLISFTKLSPKRQLAKHGLLILRKCGGIMLQNYFPICLISALQGYRILLNLNKLNVSQRRPSTSTGHGEVVFSTHFDFGPVTIDEEFAMTSFGQRSQSCSQLGPTPEDGSDPTETDNSKPGSSSSWTSPPHAGKHIP